MNVPFENVCLVESKLTENGPVYTILEKFDIKMEENEGNDEKNE